MNYKQDALWQRIEAFRIDDGDAQHPFTHKLMRENRWNAAFTEKAITEYKKFIYICIKTPYGASPSPIVDKVWHLHLTYTKNYWYDFCQNTLDTNIHHNPSRGGDDELRKHNEWYKQTLKDYEQWIGEEPPNDIWPATQTEEPRYESLVSKPWKVFALILTAVAALAINPILIFFMVIGMIIFESSRYPNGGGNGDGCGSGCSSGCGSGCGGGCGGCGGD